MCVRVNQDGRRQQHLCVPSCTIIDNNDIIRELSITVHDGYRYGDCRLLYLRLVHSFRGVQLRAFGGLFETDIFNNLLDLLVRRILKVIEGYPHQRSLSPLAAAAGSSS